MPTPSSKLALYCDALHSQYELRRNGQDTSETFDSMEDAVLRATTVVAEETEMTIYSERGKEITRTTVYPRPQA